MSKEMMHAGVVLLRSILLDDLDVVEQSCTWLQTLSEEERKEVEARRTR